MSSKKLATLVVAVVLIGAVVPASVVAKGGGGQQTSVIYSSLVASPLHGNMPSVGGEAYAFNEFGNAVTFSTSKNRSLGNVVVTMSSWGCQTGSWFAGNCLTTPGATFSVPITFNVYGASPDGVVPGALITTATQTFVISYRPSASPKCTGPDAGKWYDNSLKTCFNGLATNITFGFSGPTLPDSVVYGIAYNTTHYGYAPIGESAPCYTSAGGCGYDSLNIALSEDPTNISAGSDTNSGKVWQNSPYGSLYCDGGSAGTGFFRLDSPNTASCWGVESPYAAVPFYIPAVQFKAAG